MGRKGGYIMINWILGGIIVAITVLIIVRSVVKMKKGKVDCGCGCSGCNPAQCNPMGRKL